MSSLKLCVAAAHEYFWADPRQQQADEVLVLLLFASARYHPHVHGSTALQAGGGCFGVIIIEDEDETGLPDEVEDMEEVR